MFASAASDRIPPTSYLSRMFSIVSHGDLRFLILDCPSDSTLPSVIKILTKEGVTDVVRVCEPTYATDPLTALGIQVHDLSFKDGGVPPHSVLSKFMALVELRFHHKTLPPGFAEHQQQQQQPLNGSAPASPTAVAAEPSPAISLSRPASLRSAASVDSSDHHAPATHHLSAASVPLSASVSSSSSSSSPPMHHAPPTIAVHCVAGLGRAPVLIAVALIEHGMSPLDAIEYVRARRRGAFNTTQVKYLDAYKPQFRLHDGSGKRQGSGRGSPRLFASLGHVVSGGRRSVTASPEPGAAGAGAEKNGNGENAGGKVEKEKADSVGSASGIGGWGDAMKHKLGKLVGGLAKKRSGSAMAPKSATDLAVHQ